MGLTVKENAGGDFQLPPEGTFVARCYQIVDLGTLYNKTYENWSHKVLIGWEIPTEVMSNGKPFSVSKRYTASLSEKSTLRSDLESWRGKKFTKDELLGFELRNVIGKTCMINIAHSESGGKNYANVTAIMALPKGSVAPDPVNEPVLFEIPVDSNGSVDIDQWDDVALESLSNGLQGVIKESREYNEYMNTLNGQGEGGGNAYEEEEIPF